MELEGQRQTLRTAANSSCSLQRSDNPSTPWLEQASAKWYLVPDASPSTAPSPGDAEFASQLADASPLAAQEQYGAGSYLVGATSESADDEDVAFLCPPSVQTAEEICKGVFLGLQIDEAKLSKDEVRPLTSEDRVMLPQGSPLRPLVAKLDDLVIWTRGSNDDTRLVCILYGRLPSGWTVGLVGVAVWS